MAALALGAALAGGVPVAASYADETPLRGSLSTADVATRTVLVPIPDGVVPRRLIGTVHVDSEAGAEPRGTLEVLVDGEVVETLPARERSPVRAPIRRADVDRDGFLAVGLRWTRGCAAPGVTATLHKLRLVHGGAEQMPLDQDRFLGPAVSRVDVVVPRSAGDDVLEAALQVVAMLSRHYRDEVPVALSPADTVLPRVGAGQRVLRLEPGPSLSRGLEQRFGLWTLTVRGPGEAAVDVVRQALDTAPGTTTTGGEQGFGDLGVPTALGGWGTSSTRVALLLDLFGGAVGGLDLRLVGSHSAVPAGVLGRVDVRLDGALLESRDLRGEDTSIDLGLTIPAERLRADSVLDIILTAVPEGGCAAIGAALPLQLDLDPALSSLSPGPGDRVAAGFQRLPAALEGALAVAVRSDGRDRVEAASSAGALVAALQRTAGLALDITLTEPERLVSGEQDGLLVGAGPMDVLAVQAPVRLEDGDVPTLAGSEAFAALQAVTHRGRELVLLGGWDDEGGQAAGLARTLAVRTLDDGWGSLEGGALVRAESGRSVTLAPAAPAPGPQPPGGGRNPYAPYFLGVAGLLVLALLLQIGVVIRKDRRLRAARQP